jgi:hypothetical protein
MENNLNEIANFDQAMAALQNNFAPMAKQFHDGLVQNGFKPEEAREMAVNFVAKIISDAAKAEAKKKAKQA